MNVAVDRCESCRGLVDIEDLFCANCGTEVPRSGAAGTERVATEAKNFECKGCGASMNYDAKARSLKCPFCGSIDLVEESSRGVLAPEFVVPFSFDRNRAEDLLRGWMGSSFWHPGDLRASAQLTELKPVFVPFWLFTTQVETHWTADTSETPAGSRADWFPLYGQARRDYHDLWVPAGGGLDPGELFAILPFDPTSAVAPDRVDLVDVTVAQFSISRRYARPLVQGRIEALEAEAVAAEVPGRSRNVHVNVLMHGASSRPALAPIYVMAYRYRDRVYRFVINGQTGVSTGTAPFSKAKAASVVGIVLIVVAIIVAFALLR